MKTLYEEIAAMERGPEQSKAVGQYVQAHQQTHGTVYADGGIDISEASEAGAAFIKNDWRYVDKNGIAWIAKTR